MKPFRLTRVYHSEYSVKDLTVILRTDIGDERCYYRLAKENDDCFTLTPSLGTRLFTHSFLPIVDIRVQVTEEKPLVTVTCRLPLVREISNYTCLGFLTLLFIVMLASGVELIELLPLFFVLLCFFAVLTGAFLWGSLRHRKLFIRELKLTPITKDPKGEN